jgi:predicted ATPase/DNA-binding winged helix-turn-helix (wHTH) protein
LIRDGQTHALAEKERQLLVLMSSEPGRVFSRGEILEDIWGYRPGVKTNTLATHLRRIRNKIEENPDKPTLIETVGRRGYRMNLPPASAGLPPQPRTAPGSSSDGPQHPSTMPTEDTLFLGREKDIGWLEERFSGSDRLITLLGAPGCGKSRLAREFLSRHRETGAIDGLLFCDLEFAQDVLGVLTALSGALHIPMKGNGQDEKELTTHLGNVLAMRGIVVVLFDNVERVSGVLKNQITTWAALAPAARFVVTSRKPLNLAMEQRLVLKPLSDSASMSLFLERAQKVHPGFQRTKDNESDLDSLIQQLDGLPLVIELAAARIGMWSVSTLANRFTDRFQRLQRAGPSTEQGSTTLWSALAWSWEMLSAAEQMSLAQCSVFKGGFSWEAAEAIIDPGGAPESPWVVEVLQSLVEHSLLRVTDTPQNERRLSMLTSIQAFAKEKFDPLEPEVKSLVWKAHAVFYSQYGMDSHLDSLNEQDGLAQRGRFYLERQNLFDAAHRANTHGWGQEAVHLALAALLITDLQGPAGAAVPICRRALRNDVSPNLRARALRMLGQEHRKIGQHQEAEGLLEKALELCIQHELVESQGYVHTHLGNVFLRRGDVEKALEQYELGLGCYRKVGQRRAEGIALGNLGVLHLGQGNNAIAMETLYQALALLRETGDRRHEGYALTNLGTLYLETGELTQAEDYYTQALQVHREVGERRLEDTLLANLGFLLRAQQRHSEAESSFEQAIEVCRELGNRRVEGVALGALGGLQAERGAIPVARENLVAGESLLRTVSDKLELAKLLCTRGHLEVQCDQIDAAQKALAEAQALGSEMALAPSSDLGKAIQVLVSSIAAGQ